MTEIKGKAGAAIKGKPGEEMLEHFHKMAMSDNKFESMNGRALKIFYNAIELWIEEEKKRVDGGGECPTIKDMLGVIPNALGNAAAMAVQIIGHQAHMHEAMIMQQLSIMAGRMDLVLRNTVTGLMEDSLTDGSIKLPDGIAPEQVITALAKGDVESLRAMTKAVNAMAEKQKATLQ